MLLLLYAYKYKTHLAGENYGVIKMTDFQVLRVDERLDSENVDELKEKALSILDIGSGAIVLDMSDTKFIDSIGLGALVSILKKTAQKDMKIVLCSLSPQVRQIFELTRLYRLFDIYDSVDTARESI